MIRKFLLLLLLPLFLSGLSEVRASHNVGVDLTYECLNNCTIRVHLKAYRDCSGIDTIPPQNFMFSPLIQGGCNSGSTPPQPLGPWPLKQVTEITPVCPGGITKCTNLNSPYMGVQEYSWFRDYDICVADTNCIWTMSWSDCCRNSAITSGVSGGMAISSNVILNFSPCNSSPAFSTKPFILVCQGQQLIVNQGAYDPDGDSLSFKLGTCQSALNTPVVYGGGFSASSPLGPSWNFSMNPNTGTITITPNPGNTEVGVVCIDVEEWRNGVLIGKYTRDIQIAVQNCGQNAPPQIGLPYNVTGPGVASTDTVFVAGPVCFDVSATDPDPQDSVYLFWDQNLPQASFVSAANNSITDTVIGTSPTGRICFNPPGKGIYKFLLRGEDSHCIYNQFTDRVITVVFDSTIGFIAQADTSGCLGGLFNAYFTGDTTGKIYQWSGTGGLTGNTTTVLHQYANPGNYAWQVVISDNGTPLDTISGNLLVGAPKFTASLLSPPDTALPCSTQQATLTAASGYTAYAWSTGSTGTTLPVNTVGIYSLIATDAAGCRFQDSIHVYPDTVPQAANLIVGDTTVKTCNPFPVTLSIPPNYSNHSWFLNGSNASSSATFTTFTTGTISVIALAPNGCYYEDSIEVIPINQPDLKGTITTHSGQPLQNQKVYILAFDSNLVTLSLVDSTLTDNVGKYRFCTVLPDPFYLKAVPDRSVYPNDFPTYADTTLFWNYARPFLPDSFPLTHDFSTLYGNNNGGPGNIGGAVTQGAFKNSAVGDSIAGLNLFLIDKFNHTLMDHQVTDFRGRFNFPGIFYGDYYIKVDYPYVTTKNDSSPVVPITSFAIYLDSICLNLHSRYLELCGLFPLGTGPELISGIQVYPSPFRDEIQIELPDPSGQPIEIMVYDPTGKLLERQKLSGGTTPHSILRIGKNYPPGIYFITLKGKHLHEIRKVVKM